eukprot:4780353-Amphidinium_carterae.1
MYIKVPVAYRVRRFDLGKLKIILKKLQNEENAALKDAEEKQEAHAAFPTSLPLVPIKPIMAKSPADPLKSVPLLMVYLRDALIMF